MLRLSFLALTLTLAALPVRADPLKDARILLDLIGYRAAMVAGASGLSNAPEPLASAAPEMNGYWREAAERHLDADALVEAAAAELADLLKEEELSALLQLFGTDFARRVTALEVAAQDPELGDLPAKEGARLFAEIVRSDGRRLALFKELEQGLGAIENGVATALNFSFALMSGMVASGQMPGDPGDAEIMAEVQAQAPAMRLAVMTSIFTDLAYTYRDLSNEELIRYIAILTRPETRRLYTVTNSATEALLSKALRAIGHDLMVLAGKRKA